ncbi:putative leucine-rich repeat-containing protein DDB_G0290503 [Maniola hyperantus]|uniref:putative leucine-rich repeat-containing protein DDB_G0290503 n=1 Tax=Aphantopus hyperantus TaxID=2795564 RepID=UPI001568FF5C|nr:uncharacterized protein LOC117990796 [Maniola hyperantus]
MAQVEPMDVNNIASDSDDKENSLQNSNVFPKTSGTEKGFEELDDSEFNMKLRYSITPANSPMSRSYTANYKGDSGPNSLNNTVVVDNNLTRSLNSTAMKTDVLKSPKLPLQALPTGLYTNSDRRSCDREGNVTVTITGTDNDDNMSLPSTSSSSVQTPEATTPTKEIPKSDGSPIMRGLKSVLNIFRSSHSPVPPPEDDASHENECHEDPAKDSSPNSLVIASTPHSSTVEYVNSTKQTSKIVPMHENPYLETPAKETAVTGIINPQLVSSTPISNSNIKDSKDSSKRNSPLKESVVFNEDLERELQWQETEVFFKHEKIPIHKLLQSSPLDIDSSPELSVQHNDMGEINTTVEYMDVSTADVSYKSVLEDKSLNNIDTKTVFNEMSGVDSDNEFVDCETTFTRSKSYILETAPENKTSPVVFQTDNIPHEVCLEEFIEPNNISNKINIDEIVADNKTTELIGQSFTIETNNLTSEKPLDDFKNLPEASELAMLNDLCKPPVEITNEAFPEVIQTTNAEFPVKDHITQDDVILNVNNTIGSSPPANNSCITKINQSVFDTNNLSLEKCIANDVTCSNITDHIPNETEHSVATSQSYIQQSVEEASIIQIINDIKDLKNFEIEITTSAQNLSTNNMINEGEDAINFDDDGNTTRILFKIDELLLNKINLANLEKDIVSSNTETSNAEFEKTSEISDLNVLNTSEEYLQDESREINDTVVITNNKKINEGIENSIEMDEISKMIKELNEQTLVSDNNADEYSKLNTTSTKDKEVIEKVYLQNNEVVKTSEYKINVDLNIHDSFHLPNEKENISAAESELNIVKAKNNEEPITSLINNHHMSYIQNNQCIQDITMDSLEPDLNLINDQLTCKINKTDTHAEVDYKRSKPNYSDPRSELNKDNDLKNHSPNDIPLPNDDDIEKDSLSDLCSIKNKNYVVVISEVESEKPACVTKFDSNTENTKESEDKTNLPKPFQSLDDPNFNISHNDTFNRVPDKIQTNFNIDVEMATVKSYTIQDTTFAQLSPNLTCEKKKESQQMPSKTSEMINFNNTFTSSEIVNQPDIKVDIKSSTATFPDVVQALKNVEINDLKIKTDIKNETIHTQDNINTKGFDDEIVTSANNSPYESVSGLNLNLTSNVPADESENPLESQIKTTNSPPISPKFSRKGYNINFDEIENPFATKTNIRMSPPPRTPNRSFTQVNDNQKNIDIQRRPDRLQPEGKKPDANKKRFNSSIDRLKMSARSKTKKSSNKVDTVHTEESKINENKNVYNVNNLASKVEHFQKEVSPSLESEIDYSHTSPLTKTSSDFESQTTLFKSNKYIISSEQNLNNNPESEINDMNFDPFATKSRICVTPPPIKFKEPLSVKNDSVIVTDTTNENNFETEQTNVCTDNNENATILIENSVQNELKVSSNTSNMTSSSINTEDKDVSIRELNTEDEDTIEGPFFEAEDLDDVVNMPEIKIEKDALQCEALPATSNHEDIDNGELFIDAEAFEFLLNQNKSNVVADSGKESLFLKFDPLFAKRVSSDGVLAALSSFQKRQSTPKKLSRSPLVKLAGDEKLTVAIAGPSNVASMPEIKKEGIISTVSKPMMVVNPAMAKQPVATPRISLSPKTNRQSLNFASPAMVVIDRLLSMSGNTSLLDQGVTTDASRNHEANVVLVQLRELLAEKELHVHSLKCESKELIERLTTLESQVRILEIDGEERVKQVNTLNERLAEKTKINKSMANVVEEYERTIASLVAELEQDKKRNAEERMRLINERDEQTAHLASMEGSFSDLHSKYEKCKQIILNMKANEDRYKKSFKEFDENLLKMQKNYDLLKQHATSKLNHANLELEKLNKAHDAEVLKLTATIKRKDLHITSLEESLTQKSKANEELAAICDELINKVG